jgi:hypothetical protein
VGVPLRCAPGWAARAGAHPSREVIHANLDPLRLRQANSSIYNGFSEHLEQIMRILREISSVRDYSLLQMCDCSPSSGTIIPALISTPDNLAVPEKEMASAPFFTPDGGV